jgi:hypothetical protein
MPTFYLVKNIKNTISKHHDFIKGHFNRKCGKDISWNKDSLLRKDSWQPYTKIYYIILCCFPASLILSQNWPKLGITGCGTRCPNPELPLQVRTMPLALKQVNFRNFPSPLPIQVPSNKF